MLFTQYALAACPSSNLKIISEEVHIPEGYETGIVVRNDNTAKEVVAPGSFWEKRDNKMIIKIADVDNVKAFVGISKVRWLAKGENKKIANDACTQAYSIDIQMSGDLTEAPPQTAEVSIGNCYAAAGEEYANIVKQRGRDKNFSFIAFCSDKTTYQPMRSYGVKGDPIYIALYDNKSMKLPVFEIQTCSLEQEGVSLYNQAAVSNLRIGKESGESENGEKVKIEYRFSSPVIRTCYDGQVVINLIDRQQGEKILRSHVLNQHARYHGSFMLGTLFTDKVSHKYLAGDNGTGTTVIRDEGPFNQGPVHIISLLLHGLPHYIFDSEPYHGRDILHDNRFSDRLGLMLGVGIEKPQNNLSLGLTYELMRGINLTYSTNWTRVTELDGVKVGDAIAAGTAVPTRDSWGRYTSFGISIDFGYVTGLYGK